MELLQDNQSDLLVQPVKRSSLAVHLQKQLRAARPVKVRPYVKEFAVTLVSAVEPGTFPPACTSLPLQLRDCLKVIVPLINFEFIEL